MNIVRELRLKAGMQQKEVALYVGVANPTVSEWEHQKKDPSGERLKKLAKLFGVTPEAILGVDLNAIMAKFTTAYPMPQQNHLPIYWRRRLSVYLLCIIHRIKTRFGLDVG